MVRLGGLTHLGPMDMLASVAVICEGWTEHAMEWLAMLPANKTSVKIAAVSTLDGMVARRDRAMRTESALCPDSGT